VVQGTQPRITPEQALQMAYRHHRAGEVAQAKKIYETLLAALPHHAPALSMLASIAYLEGDDTQAQAYIDTALGSYRQAVAYKPEDFGLRAGLVNLLLAVDRLDEAESYLPELYLPLNPLRVDRETFAQRRAEGQRAGLPPLLFNTIPKSASESLWNRLAEGLGLGQCHLSIGLFPNCLAVPYRVTEIAGGGISSKEHLAPHRFNLETLAAAGIGRTLVHLRDPRQTTLSWAHFVRDDISKTMLGPLWRQSCPPAPVLNAGFDAILDWCIAHYLPRVVDFMEGWAAVADDPQAPVTVGFQTFEAFRADPDAYFDSALAFYGLDRKTYAIPREAADVHLRKGAVDEWREVFTAAQKKRAAAALGETLLDRFAWPRR